MPQNMAVTVRERWAGRLTSRTMAISTGMATPRPTPVASRAASRLA
jgi:hypothetical protein